MRKLVVLLLTVFCTSFQWASIARGADIIVTADSPPASAKPVSPLLFGHNIRFVDDGESLWDTHENETPFNRSLGNIKGPASDVMQPAVALKPGTIRYPGGAWGDKYHWREAVGLFKSDNPLERDKRKKQLLWGETVQVPKFGTDEMVEFARSLGAELRPMMQVNWWEWNYPTADPGGIAEAAHWPSWVIHGQTTQAEHRLILATSGITWDRPSIHLGLSEQPGGVPEDTREEGTQGRREVRVRSSERDVVPCELRQ